MRLSKREIKDDQIILDILEKCDTLRIGAADAQGMFIVPVNYGYECEGKPEGRLKIRFYIHSAKDGRKAEAFDKEPVVALEMDDGHQTIRGEYTCNYSFAYRSIMGNGRIRPLKEKNDKVHGLNLLMRHMDPDADICYTDEMLERVNVYCIEVTEYSGKMRMPR